MSINPAICFMFGFSLNIMIDNIIGIKTESLELTTAKAVPALLTDSANIKKAATNNSPRTIPNKKVPQEISGVAAKIMNAKQIKEAAR